MAQRVLGNGDENALSTASWKAYDAWVNLTNEAMNRVYENAAVGAVTGRTMESALRIQQVGVRRYSLPEQSLARARSAHGKSGGFGLSAVRNRRVAGGNRRGGGKRKRSNTSVPSIKTADEGLKLVRGNGHVKPTDEEKEDAAA